MSPDLKIGVTFDLFHSSYGVWYRRLFWSKSYKGVVKAGAIEAAVPRSTILEIPSGSEAVLILWMDKSLRTLSWLQVTLDSIGFDIERV